MRLETTRRSLTRFAAWLIVFVALAAGCSRPRTLRRPAATASPPSATATTASAPTRAAQPSATPAASGLSAIPPADPFALAYRLLHTQAPHTVNAQPPQYAVGQQDTFWLEDPTGRRSYTITATLRSIGDHAYFYLQQGEQIADADIARSTADFDNTIYPLVTGDVGPPATPGIDDDPRITILVADLKGAGGYFTTIDNEPASIERTSNQRKMIYVDLGSARPGTTTFDGYVAHEFQHLVHFNRNPDAQTWINEGMSEVFREQVTGSLLNIPVYEEVPDTQLDDWPGLGEGSPLPFYGAAHSFLRYLLQHYGGLDKAGVLAAEPGDGIAEVRAYLAQQGAAESFEDVFADWLVADLINDPAGGRYSQNDPAIAVHTIQPLSAPSETDATVHQFGANYYSVQPGGAALTVDFAGATTVPAIPATPPGGGSMWWSQRGDSIDSTLTRSVDLSGVQVATLQFSTWYDIERDYDFGYVEASTDGGDTWTALKGAHTTDDNPFGIALGPAYTGASGGGASPAWLDETVDLTAYAGRRILLRFEYVTDESTNRNGWAIANLRIPEPGLNNNADSDSGWTAQGFVRLTGPLPQTFLVQAVVTAGGSTSVQRLQLDQNNHGTLTIPAGAERVVLIVSGTTDKIRTPASYHLSVRPDG